MIADPALREFSELTERPDGRIDLARAALALARLEYPGLAAEAYLERLDALARGADGSRRATDPVGRLHRLREYLFVEQGFAGNREDFFDPRNSFLNDVLDRRQGIPISLSLVLIEVGKRLGLAVEGIGLPGHFVAGARFGDSQILLDSFNAGALLTPEACAELAGQALGRRVTLTPESFVAVTHRQFLARMLSNLKAIYWRRQAWERVVGVIDRLLVLDANGGAQRRDRGLAWSHLGETRRAVRDFEWYLSECRNADDHAAVTARLRQARQKLGQLN